MISTNHCGTNCSYVASLCNAMQSMDRGQGRRKPVTSLTTHDPSGRRETPDYLSYLHTYTLIFTMARGQHILDNRDKEVHFGMRPEKAISVKARPGQSRRTECSSTPCFVEREINTSLVMLILSCGKRSCARAVESLFYRVPSPT